MKSLFIAFSIIFSGLCAHGHKVPSDVKPALSDELYQLVLRAAASHLEYSGEGFAGGLYGDLMNVEVSKLEIQEDSSTLLEVHYDAYYMSADWDFGDPIDEELTSCTTTLTHSLGGVFSLEQSTTTCDCKPGQYDFDYEDYYGF